MRITGRATARRPTAAGITRVERAAQARRRRALAHLERVRDQRQAGERPPARRLRTLVLGLSFAGGAWLANAWLAGATLETISVRGARHLSARAIAAASGVEPGAPLASLDRKSVAARLTKNAWIEQARALALPGGRLLLAVVEREPVAVLAGEEPWAVDATGSPFAPAPSEGLEALPRLVAAHATTPGEFAQALALVQRLPELGLAAPLEVGIAAPNDPEGLSLRLPGLAPRVVLGREDLDAKLAALIRVLDAELPELGSATRLDLRFRDQAVLDVTPFPNGTAQAAASRGRAMSSKKRPAG
jgi:cell division protein FtsQ